MGYESRLFVVNKTNQHGGDDKSKIVWAEKIASFNLCKVCDVSDKMRKYPATNAYIYADDGNTEIVSDAYGEPLREIPISDAIKIIEDAAKIDNYRRFAPCLQLLKGFDPSEWGDLVVLHYGY